MEVQTCEISCEAEGPKPTRTAYHRLAPWGSAIEDSKNGWLCRLLAWGATSHSKQEAGERLRLGACNQHFEPTTSATKSGLTLCLQRGVRPGSAAPVSTKRWQIYAMSSARTSRLEGLSSLLQSLCSLVEPVPTSSSHDEALVIKVYLIQ